MVGSVGSEICKRDRPEEVHFHEVGAVDSIVDVVGVAVALDWLGIDEIRASPPPLGSGMVQTQHGPMPVPAPATLELLAGREVRPSGPGERTTPTGAAILAATSVPGLPGSFVPRRIGYGIGHRDFDDAPNVLRACLGFRERGGEALYLVETQIDDAAPQVVAHAIEACLQAGALDAWAAPIVMKKGRPGHLLAALAPASLRDRMIETIVRETPTLGVRYHAVDRLALERRFEEVETAFGTVPVKVASLGGEVLGAAPEWEVCRALAAASGVPARKVREEALARWYSRRP
nr:MAG: TIGR00299 family protein [Pseudomonadota bacterium]